MRQNYNNICWLVRKVKVDSIENFTPNSHSVQRLVDLDVFSSSSIAKYQKANLASFFGVGNTGVLDTLVDNTKVWTTATGDQCTVLDASCALGHQAFRISEKFGARVVALDLSCNLIGLALESRLQRANKRVQFEVGDILQRQFAPATFDFILFAGVTAYVDDWTALLDRFLVFALTTKTCIFSLQLIKHCVQKFTFSFLKS